MSSSSVLVLVLINRFSKPIGVALRDYAGIPVKEFVLACRLDNGEEKTYHSKSLRPYISKVFTERFRRDFTHYSHRANAERGYAGAGKFKMHQSYYPSSNRES